MGAKAVDSLGDLEVVGEGEGGDGGLDGGVVEDGDGDGIFGDWACCFFASWELERGWLVI